MSNNVTYIFSSKLAEKQVARENILASASQLNDRSQLKQVLLRLVVAMDLQISKMRQDSEKH